MVYRAEENYLKAIYALTKTLPEASTNALADYMQTKASSVTDMIKRLSEKGLANYTPYKGASLTDEGKQIALKTIRKHRLWEVFLVEQLDFKWDEVHEIAEQLEHIRSENLTNRLDNFLGNPKFDPHGDPIPDKNGKMVELNFSANLSDIEEGVTVQIIGVKDTSKSFLQYLETQNLLLGTKLKLRKRFDFDQSMQITLEDSTELTISNLVSKNIVVKIADENTK